MTQKRLTRGMTMRALAWLLLGLTSSLAIAAPRFDPQLVPFEQAGEYDYTVRPGDSLGSIVMQQYPDQRGHWQDMMRAIFTVNREQFVGTEHRLPVGTTLALPAVAQPTPAPVPAPTPPAPLYTAGSVVSLEGTDAQALRNDRPARALDRGAAVHVEDTIATGEDSQAVVRLVDGRLLVVRESSELTINSLDVDARGNVRKSLLTLARGGLRWVSNLIQRDPTADPDEAQPANDAEAPTNYQLRTPTSVIGIRGTDFAAQLCLPPSCQRPPSDEGTVVGLLDGAVGLSNDAAANVELAPGDVFLVSDPTTPPVSRPDLAAFVFGDAAQGKMVTRCIGSPTKQRLHRCSQTYERPADAP
ncbi:FecR family protein [Abyssibacter profundi]|nr:FecR family protein [Abyssibacter profundi]